MKKSRVVLLLLMSVLLICFSIGCKSEPSSSKSDKPKPQVTNYTVTFNANGGSGTMPAQVFAQNETKTLSANTFTRADKVFTGWNTKADGTGTPYTDGQSYTATANITLYAQWQDRTLNSYTVTFDKNDGSGITPTQTFTEGQAQNLTIQENLFDFPDGMKFVSWNTKEDGSGITYTDGQSYTATADITLYAQWDFAYLCFTAEAPNSKVKLVKHDGAPTIIPTLYYSTDGSNDSWELFKIGAGTSDGVILADIGDKFYLRGENDTINDAVNYYLHFEITGKVAASGNIMSLLDPACRLKSLDGKSYCFSHLFDDCSLLTEAPELPATTLAEYCYYSMFDGCALLAKAPELPATTLKKHCYRLMFRNCAALTEAPVLSAKTLMESCYCQMFMGCTSLINAPELPATTLAKLCYSQMFEGCTSLTKAPELPATTLVYYCYSDMFKGCTLLCKIKVYFDSWSTNDTTVDWMFGVRDNGTFICPTSLPQTIDSSHIPSGWTIETF